MTALVLSAPPVTFTAPEPPLPPPPTAGPRPTITYDLEVDGVKVGELPAGGTRSTRRNGPGVLRVSCSMDPDLCPAVTHLYWPSGMPRTWDDTRIEVRVRRNGATVWVGPVIGVDEDWQAATVEVTAWTREGHVTRLINGMREIRELFPRGHFTPGLPSWIAVGPTGHSVTTAQPRYRDPYVLRLFGTNWAHLVATFGAPASQFGNAVEVTAVVGTMGGDVTWPLDDQGRQMIGHVQHYADGHPGIIRDWVVDDVARVDMGGDWARPTVKLPVSPGKSNRYRVTVNAHMLGSGLGLVGEITAKRNANVSARAGWDVSTFAAAAIAEAETELGAPWGRFVEPAGVPLHASKVEPWADHGDIASFLDDLSEWGEWWVEMGTRTIRWAPTRGVTHGFTLGPENMSKVRRTVDAKGAATVAVAFADGQSGPTREEGRAERSPRAATLHAVLGQQPGADVRDLERDAAAHLAGEGRPKVMLSGVPTRAVLGEGVQGDVQHVVRPGDRVPWAGARGVAGGSGTYRVEVVEVDDASDSVSVLLEAV